MERYFRFYERQVAIGIVIAIASFVIFLVTEIFK